MKRGGMKKINKGKQGREQNAQKLNMLVFTKFDKVQILFKEEWDHPKICVKGSK